MPRIAEHRAPAAPASPEQEQRYRRILEVASDHASRLGPEGMQMQEVAAASGVAIGTLYRYFPSKTQLLAAVLEWQVNEYARRVESPGDRAADHSLADTLIMMATDMLARPTLSLAILQANVLVLAQDVDHHTMDRTFLALMSRACGWDAPGPSEHRLLRIIQQAWFGMVLAALNGHTGAEALADDTRLLCRAILNAREVPPGS